MQQPPRLTYFAPPEPNDPHRAHQTAPPFRPRLVLRIRERIADGSYDTDSKIERVIDSLTDRPAA